MRKTKRTGILLTAAALALAAVIAATGAYALAKYVSVVSDVTAGVSLFDVTSSITYVDEWGEARSFDGDLGTMKPVNSHGNLYMDFTFTVHNKSEVDVNCYLTLSGDYDFTFEEVELTEEEKESYGTYTIPEDDKKTLYMDETVAAGSDSMPVTFRVHVGDYTGYTTKDTAVDATEYDVYSGFLNIRAEYVQAS